MLPSGRLLLVPFVVLVFAAVSSAERSLDGEALRHPQKRSPSNAPAKEAPRQYRLSLFGDELLLVTDRGEEVLRIPARLDASYGGERAGAGGQWEQRGPGVAVAHAENDHVHVTFTVRAHPRSPFVEARVRVRYLKSVLVDHEVWTHRLEGVKGRVLDRGYRWRPLGSQEIVLDRFTPLVGQLMTAEGPAFAYIGDDDFQAARITGRFLHLELDHWANHPHTVYKSCYDRYAPRRSELGLSTRPRDAGDEVEHRVRFAVGQGRVPVLRRWPDDRQAAFVLVDHADNGRTESLRALLEGDSSGRGQGGLFGNDLVVTRTAFDHPRQMGDPAYRSLLDELQKRGGEVAPHSITPWREDTEHVKTALSTSFAAYAPRTWVDHQPDTNCEAINNHGGRRGHESNVVGILQDAGVRYLWEAPDPDFDGDLNLLRPRRGVERAAFFYPAPGIGPPGDRRDPWLFITAWMFVPTRELARRLGDKPLARLVEEHGVHLGHTYLGAVHRAGKYQSNTIFTRNKRGVLSTRPEVEEAWKRLGDAHRGRDLWVTTVGDLGDWLSTWDRVRLEPETPTRLRVTHDPTLRTPAKRSGAFGQRVPELARVETGFTVAARWQGSVDGEARRVVSLGDVLDVDPPMYEDDLGVSFAPLSPVAMVAGEAKGTRRPFVASVVGQGYGAPPASAELFAVAKDLGAPGTHVEEACLASRAGGCIRTALEPFYERLDGLLGVGIEAGRGPGERARILVFGNSLIASDRVTDIVRQRLQHRFGDGGRGIVYVDALQYFGRRAWTGEASDGWYAEYLTQYLGERPPAAFPLGITGGHFVAYKSGASTVWPVGGSRAAELYWLDHARAPTFSVLVDGEVQHRVRPRRTGAAEVLHVDLPPTARTFGFVTEGPRAVVYGATLERPEPGVVLDTVGIVAASANSYLKTDPAIFGAQLKARDPALVVLMLGGNEARRIDRGVFTEEEVAKDFVAFLARVKESVPNAACLTVGPIETVFVHTPRSQAFQTRPFVRYVVDTERAISLEEGCAFVDLFAAMGGEGSLQRFDERGYLSEDRIHPMGPGLDVLGELVADALLRGYAESRPYRKDAMAGVPGSHDALLQEKAPGHVVEGELMPEPPPAAARIRSGGVQMW